MKIYRPANKLEIKFSILCSQVCSPTSCLYEVLATCSHLMESNWKQEKFLAYLHHHFYHFLNSKVQHLHICWRVRTWKGFKVSNFSNSRKTFQIQDNSSNSRISLEFQTILTIETQEINFGISIVSKSHFKAYIKGFFLQL